MASPFTYLSYDLTTWDRQDVLPYRSVGFGDALNAGSTFQGSLAIADPDVQKLNWQNATRPGRTALFVDWLGKIVWGGTIGTRNYQEPVNPPVLQVTAQTMFTWGGQRLQAKDYSTTFSAGTDPMVIASTILIDVLKAGFAGTTAGANFGGPGISVVMNGASAPAIIATYPGTQLQSVDSIINTLAQMGYGQGFDYSWDCAYNSAGVPQMTLNFWFPVKGKSQSASGILVMHRQVSAFNYPEDATQMADSVFVTGSSSGAQITQPVSGVASSVISQGYPLLEKAASHTQVNDEAVLVGVALGLLTAVCWPIVTPVITMKIPAPDPITFPNQPGNIDPSFLVFGQFALGDVLTHVIEAAPVDASGIASFGINNSPRFPNGYSFGWRITQWQCTVADQGMSTILFDLALPVGTAFPPTQAPLV